MVGGQDVGSRETPSEEGRPMLKHVMVNFFNKKYLKLLILL